MYCIYFSPFNLFTVLGTYISNATGEHSCFPVRPSSPAGDAESKYSTYLENVPTNNIQCWMFTYTDQQQH